MAIDPELPIPVYFQLKTLLLEEILEGRYGPDGRLPTEHQLCERHGISRTPVTRALSELATEGVVIRHRRRGTFVNPHWLGGHRGGPELRVVVPEGPWEGLIRRAAPADTRLSVATVELHELHQALACSPARRRDNAIEVVVLQMAAHPGDLGANVDRLAELVGKHADGAELVVAPELVTSGYELDVLARQGQELAEPLDGPTTARISELATQTGATLVFGMLERDGDVLYDTAVVAAPDGHLVPYRKSHLYPTEQELFGAGTELVVAPTPAGRLGMMICFEHAFPDVATTLALRGAQILVIPSAVPFGYEHLLTLRTRARAQDNQVFAVGCNLAGNGFCGRSLVADPRGEVLAEAGTSETVLRATLDLAAIEREREREPALRLRQPDLYRHGRR